MYFTKRMKFGDIIIDRLTDKVSLNFSVVSQFLLRQKDISYLVKFGECIFKFTLII